MQGMQGSLGSHSSFITVEVFRKVIGLYYELLLALKSGKGKATYNPYPVSFSYLESSRCLAFLLNSLPFVFPFILSISGHYP